MFWALARDLFYLCGRPSLATCMYISIFHQKHISFGQQHVKDKTTYAIFFAPLLLFHFHRINPTRYFRKLNFQNVYLVGISLGDWRLETYGMLFEGKQPINFQYEAALRPSRRTSFHSFSSGYQPTCLSVWQFGWLHNWLSDWHVSLSPLYEGLSLEGRGVSELGSK